MSSIHVLPAHLADKIAAGEVVERPASVVKELVENALDAGAKKIRVDVFGAGKKKIEVVDDGYGMTTEEVTLSIRRHATSKIRDEEDLSCITTLGFRGEALPSVAAVSKLTFETKPQSNTLLEGTYLSMEGGELKEVRAAGCPRGTKVSVEDLFFNTPARLKFLKSDGVEKGHMEGTILQLALSHLEVAFEYYVDGKQKLSCPISKDPLQRLQNCLGKSFVEDVMEIREENPEIRLHGWILHPRQTAGNANSIYTFLNGRFLKDRVLQHAVRQGFDDFLMKGQYPKAVLYIQMNPEEVDVNVHPAKREVRFRQPQVVHQFVSKAVRKHLHPVVYGVETQSENRGLSPPGLSDKRGPSAWGGPPTGSSTLGAAMDNIPRSDGSTSETFFSPPIGEGDPIASGVSSGDKIRFKDFRVIGALADTYILCEGTDNRLVLIDQHAAHEWIGYRKLKKNYEEHSGKSQRLLVPMTWEPDPHQAAVLKGHLDTLHKAGLEIEPFGGDTFVVKSVPTLVSEKKIPALLEKICEELESLGGSCALQKTIEHVLITMACHAQVRAHDKLSLEEMKHLLVEMDAYRAVHCPHGRPTYVCLTLVQIEKWFKRT